MDTCAVQLFSGRNRYASRVIPWFEAEVGLRLICAAGESAKIALRCPEEVSTLVAI